MSKLPVLSLRALGLLLVAVGLVAAYYGPLEIYVFYFFSEGGQFHYPGFGIGSLWFAVLVAMNLGYYIIAALCLPLGIGHITLRRWALTLARLYAWYWLAAGALLLGAFVLLIPSVLRLSLPRPVLLAQIAAIGVALLIALVLLPLLALWFYRRPAVAAAFAHAGPNQHWTDRLPLSVLALLLTYFLLIIAFHLAIFLQGLFPLFGRLLLGRPSLYLISLSILILACLIYGAARLQSWAWWGGLVFLTLLALSTLLTFSGQRFSDLIALLTLPPYELDLLTNMPVLHDYPLAGLTTAPLLAALALLLSTRPHFKKSAYHVPSPQPH